MSTATTAAHASFELLRSQTLEALNITISEYRHHKTGAQHIHMDADNEENVFLVALRTVPEDSTGVAHILEHTALCGSNKYPVRDPFFMMIRRSLNTFMNAFTSSDWTAYPFASQNRKDFDNLLDVYLDAVFFSRLDPLDFAQEGHRIDFSESGNTDSPLVYKGVVYNEMKGAMSSVSSQLWQTINKYLYPTTTYHHNSGGDPQVITDLSYDQLKQFYQSHYHPSNAIFMTFGTISAKEHQAVFEDRALQHFDALQEQISVPPEKRYFAPIRAEEAYPYSAQAGEDPEQKAHIVMGWLLGPSIDLKANLEVDLLSTVLLDNSASPLQHLLETTDLGASPSPLCGASDSQYEMLFMCGLADTNVKHTQAFEEAVTKTLETIVAEGLPQEQIEAALHQLELQHREIGGDGYPYGLQLILNGLSAATHRGDVLAFMDLESALSSLREAIQSASYIPELIQRLLLNNKHRVTLSLRADSEFQQQQIDDEVARLAAIKSSLGDTDKQSIVAQAMALDQRQQQQDDDSILPKVTLSDIPKTVSLPLGEHKSSGSYAIKRYQAGTNGISYQQLVCHLPKLSDELLNTVPFYTMCLTELGIDSADYLQVQQRQSQTVGSIFCYYNLKNHCDDAQKLVAYLTLTAKSLNRNQQAMSQLMADTLEQVRFDESDRLQELITQTRIGREQSITGNGHVLAMQAASANCNPTAKQIHSLMGLGGIQGIKSLEENLQNGHGAQFQEQLRALHQAISEANKDWLIVSEAEVADAYLESLEHTWKTVMAKPCQHQALDIDSEQYSPLNQAWISNSQVHFCAKAYPTVATNHGDAAPLSVLAGVLRNGFLHRAIREQGGAYGGGAVQDNGSGSFRFYSYRDPRMAASLDDFDQSIQWLFDKAISAQSIEESILGMVSSLDKPGSPAGEAKREFHATLTGRTAEKRMAFRERLLSVTAEDLRRVAAHYLKPEKGSVAVLTGNHGADEAKHLGLDIITL
ncbi:MAG: insulinase family protein [Pseudomonadota bacterium]